MKIFLFELKKLWGKKEFLLYFFVLVALNFFMLWITYQPAGGNVPPAQAYRHLANDIKGFQEAEKEKYIDDKYEMLSAMMKLDHAVKYLKVDRTEAIRMMNVDYKAELAEYGDIYSKGQYLQYTDSLYAEYRFFETMSNEIHQAHGYQEFLDNIQKKSQQLSQISVFNKEGSYDSLNIKATSKAYEGIRDIKINFSPQEGVVNAISFRYSDIILVFAMLLLASFIVRDERDNGLLALIRTSGAGRGKTAVAKLMALSFSMLIVVSAVYGVNLFYCNITYGIGDLSRSIQSIPYLMRSTMRVNLIGYLLIFIFTKWIAAFICGAWVLLAMVVTKKVFTGYVLALLMPALNLIIRNIIPATSHFNVIKYSNLVSFLTTNEILGGYRNIYWFGKPVRLFWVEVIAALIFAVIFVLLFIGVFSKSQLLSEPKSSYQLFKKKKFKATTVLKQEWYKLTVMNGGALLLALFCVFQCYQAYKAENYIDADEIFYSYYMKNITGTYDHEAYNFMIAEGEKFEPILKAKSMRSNNLITAKEYELFMSSNFALQMEYNIYSIAADKIINLHNNPGTQLIYDTGYNKFFDFNDHLDLKDYLATGLMTCIIFAGLFAMEKSSGMIKVVRSTPLGMTFTAQSKVKTAAIMSAFITMLAIMPRVWQVYKGYGFSGLFVSAKSLAQFAKIPQIVNVLLMIIFMLIMRYAVSFTMAMTVLYISNLSVNYLSSVMFSLMIIELPPLTYYFGVSWAKWLSLYNVFHIVGGFANIPMTILAFLYLVLAGALIYFIYQELMKSYDIL
ncbi:MAG: hypothetical protein RR198_02155 [Oscillospiraceae bacterium]